MVDEPGGASRPVDPALLEDDPHDLYERAPVGYLSTIDRGTIVRVNQTFADWTGHKAEDLVGDRRFQDLLSVGGRIYWDTHLRPLLDLQDEVKEIALEVLRADGSRMPALVNVRNAKVAPGVTVRRITVFDATDRRSYEGHLLEARRRAERSEEQARLLASTLQRSLLPPSPPQIPGLEVAAVYHAAGQGAVVGGDFYDVFELSTGDWMVALGDICGKGAEAAAVTALARYTIRADAMRSTRPGRVLELLNAAMRQQQVDRFCTVALARLRLDATSGEAPGMGAAETVAGTPAVVTLALAGHPNPVFVPSDGTPTLVGTHGSLMGVFDQPTLADVDVPLRPGDGLVMFTDGVTEGRQGADQFGTERIVEVLASLRGGSASDLAEGLARAVLDYQDGRPRDDIAIVALRLPPNP